MARIPRNATPQSLENAALHYLERFASSADNLRRVLLRRVERSARFHDTDRDDGARMVEDVIAKLRAKGLLDDRMYAEGRVASLQRRGTSGRMIRLKLLRKGVDADTIDRAFERAEEETGDGAGGELAAAVALARRRRLGPWRPSDQRAAMLERDLAALSRAGFSYDIARAVVEAESPEDLEEGMGLA